MLSLYISLNWNILENLSSTGLTYENSLVASFIPELDNQDFSNKKTDVSKITITVTKEGYYKTVWQVHVFLPSFTFFLFRLSVPLFQREIFMVL